jgi:hypothetical protein
MTTFIGNIRIPQKYNIILGQTSIFLSLTGALITHAEMVELDSNFFRDTITLYIALTITWLLCVNISLSAPKPEGDIPFIYAFMWILSPLFAGNVAWYFSAGLGVVETTQTLISAAAMLFYFWLGYFTIKKD